MENHEVASKVKSNVKVSLVVPVRNEANTLERFIDSIHQQTFLPDEIVIVDGGSNDDTVGILRKHVESDPRFKLIEAKEATPGRGRNIGILAARNEWIALTDAGIRLEPTWLERLVEIVQRDPSISVVYGNYEPVTDSFFESCAALAYVAPKQQRAGKWMRGPVIASSLLRREVWAAVGGFPDLRAAEDLIFMESIGKKNFKIGWSPTATIWWQLRPTLAQTFRKFVLYSRHNVLAGRQRGWHYAVLRQYVVAAVIVALAVTHNYGWLVVLGLGIVARVAKNVWRRREGRGFLWALNPVQFTVVLIVILAIDLATFVGWIQAALRRSTIGAGESATGVRKS